MPRRNDFLDTLKHKARANPEFVSLSKAAELLEVPKSTILYNIRVGNVPEKLWQKKVTEHKEYVIKI